MTFYPNACFIGDKIVPMEEMQNKGYPVGSAKNPVWLKTDLLNENQRQDLLGYLIRVEDQGDIVWVAGETRGNVEVIDEDGYRSVFPYEIINDGSFCWSLFDFAVPEMAQDFAAHYSTILVTNRDRDVARHNPPDTTVQIDGNIWERTEKDGSKHRFYKTDKDMWFSDSPYQIIEKRLGLTIEPGKVRNLLSWSGERTLDIFYYLGLLSGHSPAVVNEVVNFILGPFAAELKVKEASFDTKHGVLDSTAIIELAGALSLGLVPDGSRKDLYAALLRRYNTELAEVLYVLDGSLQDAAQIVFYNILGDVLEPIFTQAGGDEIAAMVKAVLDANPEQAAKIAEKDQRVIGWAMGQVMNAAKPAKLDAQTVRAAILDYKA